MNTAKVYQDNDGNDCSIVQMVSRDPHWAANRIQEGEQALARVRELESALRDLLNDCINFDGGKLTDIFMENASRALKQKPGDLDGNRGSEYSEQDRTGT